MTRFQTDRRKKRNVAAKVLREVSRPFKVVSTQGTVQKKRWDWFERFCALSLLLILFAQPMGAVFAAGEEVTESLGSQPEESTGNDATPVALEPEVTPSEEESEAIVPDLEPTEPEPSPVEAPATDTATAAETTDATGETVPTQTATPVPTPALDSEAQSETVAATDASTTVPVLEIVETGSVSATGTVSSTSPVGGTSTESGSTPSESAEAVSTSTASTTPVGVPTALFAEILEIPLETEVATDTATSSVTVEMPEVTTQVNDQNRYQFGINDCVTMEDGFFYCAQKKQLAITGEDRVFAAQDADGDLEIYVEKGGETIQLTNNAYDDNAPYYDPESDRLVWHALMNDRYQVMLYDLKDEKVQQLTDDPWNNMEPVALGDTIVWQTWLDNNWEIVMEKDGERTRLTENTTHDIDPHMRGDLIMWQHFEGESWSVEVYNIKTGKRDMLAGVGGDALSNPRLMLVYDSLGENGEKETVGYDLDTKTVVPLTQAPGSVPENIPEPEHSKEERALVAPNTNLKEEMEDLGDGLGTTTPTIDPPLPEPQLGTSTPVVAETASSSPDTLVIPPLEEPELEVPDVDHIDTIDLTATSTADTAGIAPLPTIPDLIVTPTSSTTSAIE